MEYLPRDLPPRTGLTPAEGIHFAIPERIRAEALIFEDGGVTVLASADAVSPRCPACGQPSRRTHSRYYRTLADLPWGGVPVRFRLRARKLFCDEPACPRKIFAERLDGMARWYARRTDRQRGALEDIGLALGGRAGARLAARLGLRASRDTLLRLLRWLPLHIDYTPRALGVDDWSLRKAQIYGTILVDLERHRVVDLLPDRSAETLAEWLLQHRGVKVIARDRSGAYADGITVGAPGAVQVADRWHLAKNLGDALEEMLSRNRPTLKDVRSTATEGTERPRDPPLGCWDAASRASPLARSHSQQQAQRTRRQGRLERYRRLMELRERGATIKEAAREAGIGERTANRWIAAGGYPERRVRRRTRRELDEHEEYIRNRWKEGCRNRTQIWREICEQGYSGPRHPHL
jgi:transposase